MSNNPSEIFSFEDASQDIPASLQSDLSSIFSMPMNDDRVKVIWGTTINVNDTIEKFKEFLHTKYREKVNEMLEIGDYILILNIKDVDEELKLQIRNYPSEIIPILEQGLAEVLVEKKPVENLNCRIRICGVDHMICIRNMDVGEIDKIVGLQCMVLRCSGVIPEILRAFFVCSKCGREFLIENVKGVINEPVECECGAKFSFNICHQKGIYMDKQIVKVQELPENVPDGSTPMTMTVICNEELVDAMVPGNRVKITGILKAVPVRLSRGTKSVKSVFRSYLELLHVEILDKEEEEPEIEPENYEKLLRSIAPSIFGMEDVKKALLLQLFGGVQKETENTRFRGDINILLVGDPGVAKSQLLTFIHKLSDRGMYTSGNGSSAVGLTATVSRDPDTKQFILESGALVLSDNGICCIDEFDKMNESTRSILHEAMEQQTVSVAKAGIITTLNARCAILASCNPVESRYNIKKSIIENINLPPTLLSRFDIICILIDKSDEENDKRVANHIVGLYTQENDHLSLNALKRYIEKAKKIIPKLTPEAINKLRDSYCELRQLSHGKTITATTRQLESLIRLSEAHARMRLSGLVEIQDVNEALRIVKESLLMYAIDPQTGRIDMDLVMTGRSRKRMERIEDLKKEILKNITNKMNYEDLLKELDFDGREALKELLNENIIIVEKDKVIINRDD